MKKIVALLMILVLMIGVASQGSVQAKTAAKEVSTLTFSGEEFFKGLFFGQGKVAERLPDFYSEELRETTNTPEMEKQVDKLIQQVKEKDSSYFKELKKAVYSDNPQKIEKAINKGSDILANIIKDMGVSKADFNNGDYGTGEGRCAVLGLVAIYYAAVLAQAVVGLAYIAQTAVYLTDFAVKNKSRSADGDNLSNDLLIHDIVVNF